MTHHRLAVTLALLCLLCLCALAASADSSLYGASLTAGPVATATPSYLGATGLLITPTAMIAAPLKGAVYFHQIRSDPDQSFFGVTLGLPLGLEVSGVRLENLEPLPTAPDDNPDATVFNAKWQVPLESWLKTSMAPKVAVGAFDAGNEVNRTYYLALSRSFSLTQRNNTALNLHLGWGHPNKDDTRLDGLFAGFDFVPFSKALVQVEYDAKDINANIRFSPVPRVSLDLGVVADDFAWGATFRSDW